MKHRIRMFFVTLSCLLPSSYIFATDSIFPFKVATWNIEWLSSHPDPTIPKSIRTNDDYELLKRYFKIIAPDVLAFQEVNDKQAISRIVGSGYHIVLSERANDANKNHQFPDLNQYTGFAIKHRLSYQNAPDVQLISKRNSKLRFGSHIILGPDSAEPIHLLSVHLKAGCSGAYRESYACFQLEQQAQTLNDWIKQREQKNQHYVIAGDFNHNLAYSTDWMWEIIKDQRDLTLATRKTKANCKVRSSKNANKTHQFRSVIDHIIISNSLSTSKVKQSIYSARDVLDHRLSDHCPVTANINAN
ncbi:endonuclease/exonuclease/phosphatase family protein [Vibrio sp. FNV 38]|nr:endonuclease/exonuclease/phosphatase family protein [Vibrio sp. FNV 38]